MKTVLKRILIGLFVALLPLVHSQSTFVNLNFEEVIPPLLHDIDLKVPVTNALPGWTVYEGGIEVSRIRYDVRTLDAAAVSLHDINSDSFRPISGQYSVFIQGSFAGPTATAAISQVGQLPADTESLRFLGSPLSRLQVTFDGHVIPLAPFGVTNDFVIFAGDISAFAGQTGELRFTGLPRDFPALIDDIAFSPEPIPEPATWALLALGLGALWLRRRRAAQK